MEYTYSKPDLLKNPQKYQKTPYLGLDFLNTYKISRLSKISSLEVTDFSLNDFLDSLTTNFKDNHEFLLSEFLNYILIMTKNEFNFNIVKKNTDLVLKKFELKKKLFIKYDSKFKEIVSDYDFLRNYLLLSLLCVIQYEKSLSLKYLNSCLKINDTISSQIIESLDDITLFKYVLEKEVEFINQLCNKTGIAF